MATLTDIQQDWTLDLIETEQEQGNQVFTWNGVDYACSPSAERSTITPDIGTINVDRFVTMTVRLYEANGNEVFTVLPKGQQYITYDGQRWTILTVDKYLSSGFIRLTCHDDSRGVHG